MLRKYWYKLLAPVIITILLLIWFVYNVVAALAFATFVWDWWPLVICLIFGAASCVSVYVLWERIKEIESGEEDDISQY